MATQNAIVSRPVLDLITASKPKFEGRLPQGMTVDRFMYGLATACQKNANLMKCNPQSVVLAAYEAAEVGCDLSPSLALGWIIPYGDVAQFQPSYRFFIQKAYETGAVTSFFAEVVYENDEFVREFAPKRTLRHRPPSNNERGNPIGAYALIEFKDGHLDWEYLSKEQIERHRKASKMPESMMWKTFWEEGWKKTPLRVLAKRLPMSNPGLEKLAEAINRDSERDSDPVIPGRLDIERGTELQPVTERGPQPVATEPEEQDKEAVTLHVGKLIATIKGLKLRRMFTLQEMKPLGLRIGADSVWTIPAGNASEFVKLCDVKNFVVIETDADGKPLTNTYAASELDLPDNMFDAQPETV